MPGSRDKRVAPRARANRNKTLSEAYIEKRAAEEVKILERIVHDTEMNRRTTQSRRLNNLRVKQTYIRAPRKPTIGGWLLSLEQRYESSNGNPVHVWYALIFCIKYHKNRLGIPEWCIEYLDEVAQNLLDLFESRDFRLRGHMEVDAGADQNDTITSEKAAELVPQAIGLTRSGWSAFKRQTSDALHIARALTFERLRQKGLKYDDAVMQVSKMRGRVEEFDATKKSIKAGKRLLAHVPRGAKQNIQSKARRRLTRQDLGKN